MMASSALSDSVRRQVAARMVTAASSTGNGMRRRRSATAGLLARFAEFLPMIGTRGAFWTVAVAWLAMAAWVLDLFGVVQW
jgi:hypothetical protein